MLDGDDDDDSIELPDGSVCVRDSVVSPTDREEGGVFEAGRELDNPE